MEGLLGVRRHSLVLPPPPAHPRQPGSSGTLGSQRRETACEGQRGKEIARAWRSCCALGCGEIVSP